jgi:hypothetical protein
LTLYCITPELMLSWTVAEVQLFHLYLVVVEAMSWQHYHLTWYHFLLFSFVRYSPNKESCKSTPPMWGGGSCWGLCTHTMSGFSIAFHTFSDLKDLPTFVIVFTPWYVKASYTALLSYHWTAWIATPSTVAGFSVIVSLSHFFISIYIRVCNLAIDLYAQYQHCIPFFAKYVDKSMLEEKLS